MRLSIGIVSWRMLLPWFCAPSVCMAQDLEPRRWTHLPIGTNIIGVGYAYTTGDLGFDPVLQLSDVELEMHTATLGYTRYFALADSTARIDVVVPLRGTWLA